MCSRPGSLIAATEAPSYHGHSTTTRKDDDVFKTRRLVVGKGRKAKREEKNLRHSMCDSVHIVCCRCDKTERVGTGQPPTRLINPIIVLTLCDCSTRMMHRSFLARSWAKCDYRIWMILKNSLRSFMFKLVHEQSEMNRSRKRSQN